MGSQSETSRVSYSLTVVQDHIGKASKSSEGLEQKRGFPEAQQPWDIGKGDSSPDEGFIHEIEIGVTEDDHGSNCFPPSRGIGHIGPGN